MERTSRDAEFVDGEDRVQLLSEPGHLVPQGQGALVIDHRVHVDDGLDVVALLQFPLDVVHYVVDLQQVAAGGDLHVEGHHGPPGAVVMVD